MKVGHLVAQLALQSVDEKAATLVETWVELSVDRKVDV